MSSSNPRKFSEKIAILKRKEEEEQNEVDRILGEVRNITRPPPQVQAALIPGAWPRPGGSLPNVHEMVQQPGAAGGIPQVLYPSEMMAGGWLPAEDNVGRVMHAHRNRSPGAHPHFHPYRGSPGHMSPAGFRQSSPERVPSIGVGPPYYHPVVAAQHQLLQPPDPNWRRAVSDPTIHNSLMHGPAALSGSSSHTPPPHTPTPPQMASPGDSPADTSQGSPTLFYTEMESKGAQNAVEMKPDSCDTSIPNFHAPLTGTQSHPVVSPSAAFPGGSLPDFARGAVPPGFSLPPPYGEAMSGAYSGNQAPVQQRHSIQLPVPPGVALYGPPRMPSPSCTLAATPPYAAESQSAPNSPATTSSNSPPAAATAEGTTCQYSCEQLVPQIQNIRMAEADVSVSMQWYQQQYQQPSPRFSVAPSSGNIPNIILTNADGSVGQQPVGGQWADYFSDLQNLDPADLRELLLNDDAAVVDAASEDALRMDRD